MKGFVDAASIGDIEFIRALYEFCKPSSLEEVIASAISSQEDDVVDALSDMTLHKRKMTMIFRNAADMYINGGKPKKAYAFYEKAIATDSNYQTAYLHYANSIVSHFCSYECFDEEMALKAKSCFNQVTSLDPGYSYAYKKLGILYQLWSEHDNAHMQELEIKALQFYIKAIECKKDVIKYDSVYSEIKILLLANISTNEVQNISS
jgi:tetratricopeptide (TPR) repeat protein